MVYPAVGPSFLEPLPSRQQYAPTYGAIFDSLSRMENIVGQGAFNLGLYLNRDSTPDENFDPYETVWGTKYENSMGAFTKAQNQLDVELIKQRMEQGQQDRETVFQAGGKAIAPMFLVGNLDPTILLPVGATLKGATKAGTFFKNAARVGAATGAAVGVQEAGLHYLQDFRTREETVGAITASVILGGMLGGAASLWSGKAFRAAADNVYRETADADTLSKLIREAEEQGQFQQRDRTFADTGQFRARRELDELAEGFDVGEKWTELQLKADYFDQSYDLGISHDGILNTPERILEQILPKQQAKNVSSILLPETLMKIRKQANKPLTQPSLAETNIDLLGDPSIKFTGLDYLEAEFESYAKMKLSTDEVDEIITGLLDRGVSRDEIKDIAKRVLRKSVVQKQKPKSTGLLVDEDLDFGAVGDSLGKLEDSETITITHKPTKSTADLEVIDDVFGIPGKSLLLTRLLSRQRGGGGGTKVLEQAIESAETRGIPLVTEARPYKGFDLKQLEQFYEKHGFEKVESDEGATLMVRKPGRGK